MFGDPRAPQNVVGLRDLQERRKSNVNRVRQRGTALDNVVDLRDLQESENTEKLSVMGYDVPKILKDVSFRVGIALAAYFMAKIMQKCGSKSRFGLLAFYNLMDTAAKTTQ